MVRTHKDVLRKALKDPQFKMEYDALEREFELRHVLLRLRRAMNITQREIAERLGTKQEYISRVEQGHVNMSVAYLARLADACDAEMDIVFRPKDGKEPIGVTLAVG